ncbi:SWIM zinc finger family protein [Deinococcus multiflagellatus]|uniref:SWIM zinc finger family protein n=1 Tax=Deinococcus multiflagellatus TaxID=1656887 RepID=UPI001CC98454|nr:SWIM zinc finger family protein [Deinococcus multiflagellatus]MBZ9716104.1 SWIM zinc finger family protein [Deinococcus multiflagellatus]
MVELSVNAARAHVGAHEWRKGQPYVAGLTALSAQPDGDTVTLSGIARGQERYRVQATVRAGAVEAAHCSCPVGGGGGCKHVAALLARAAGAPEDFEAWPDLDATLAALSADDLRALVRRLLRREPDLTRLVVAGGSGAGLAGQLQAAFAEIAYDPEEDWEGEGPDLSDVWPLAEELSRLGETPGANPQAVLNAAVALLDGAAELQDEDYGVELHDLAAPARSALLRLLARELAEDVRSSAHDALHEAAAEFGWGAAEIAQEGQADLFAALPPEDRALSLGFLHGLLDAEGRAYRRQELARTLGVLGQLGAGEVTPEAEVTLARAAGDLEGLVRLLLAQGCVPEAVAALGEGPRPVPPQQVEAPFREFGLLDALEAHARANLRVYGARAWLYGHFRETGRDADAHTLALDAVLHGTGDHPDFTASFLPRDLDWLAALKAVSPDWPADRETLMDHWAQQRLNLGCLVLFLLQEGLGERALPVFRRHKADPLRVLGPHLATRLALALPAAEAKPLLLQAAAAHIQGRGRKHYADAAGALRSAAPLLGHEEVRSAARLFVQEYPTLRALKEELTRAGLL